MWSIGLTQTTGSPIDTQMSWWVPLKWGQANECWSKPSRVLIWRLSFPIRCNIYHCWGTCTTRASWPSETITGNREMIQKLGDFAVWSAIRGMESYESESRWSQCCLVQCLKVIYRTLWSSWPMAFIICMLKTSVIVQFVMRTLSCSVTNPSSWVACMNVWFSQKLMSKKFHQWRWIGATWHQSSDSLILEYVLIWKRAMCGV